MPAALRPELEVFLRGKIEYPDEAVWHKIYVAYLAVWASELIHGAILAAPLPLTTLDLAALRAATLRQV